MVFDATLSAFLFSLGLIVGSFANVVVLRYGFSELSAPRSRCMACNIELTSLDLIPIVSFMVLRGRCRSCGSRLSLQYPLVELAVAFCFALSALVFPTILSFASVVAFVALLVFLVTLIALVAYDIRHTLVPMPFVFVLILSALVATIAESFSVSSWTPFLDSMSGAGVLIGFFLLLYFITHGRGMGLGDAYVAGAIGLLLGLFRGIEAIMFAVWIGTAMYLVVFALSSLFKYTQLFRRIPQVTMKSELPFVPFLALGFLMALCTDISPLALGAWLIHYNG